MTEREQVDPKLLAPEYWGGHKVDDDCSGSEAYDWPRSMREVGKARKFSTKILREYLATEERTVLRTYKPGDLFEARD